MKKLIYLSILFCSVAYPGCEKNTEGAGAGSSIGKGGSLAKFTIIGNYVYAVSSHYLYTIDISDPSHPVKVNQSQLNYDMETIYPYKNRLFIGSKTGLYIYSVDTASSPRLIGEAKHGRSCDPVVANDSVSSAEIRGLVLLAYVVGSTVLLAASVFNPIGPSLILLSGVSSGFAAMAGLTAIPHLVENRVGRRKAGAGVVAFKPGWVVTGLVVAIVFTMVV